MHVYTTLFRVVDRALQEAHDQRKVEEARQLNKGTEQLLIEGKWIGKAVRL